MPNPTISAEKTVEFAETDAAGLVHYSNYLRYVEIAERALFEKIDAALLTDLGHTLSGYPRTRVKCDYSAPLRFGDRIRIELSVTSVGEKSLGYRFRILKKIDADNWTRAAKGELITVHAEVKKPGGEITPLPLSPDLKVKLGSLIENR
jgi:YbgC/YbaW family acyl-CoA thioester hydrolase